MSEFFIAELSESFVEQYLGYIILGGPALVTALFGFAVARIAADRERKRREGLEQERERLFREAATELLADSTSLFNLTSSQVDELVNSGRLEFYQHTPSSREEVRREVQAAITTLQARLEHIERRFPEEATLEKIASVNDAILATRLEQLEKSIENLESRLLTKWDVATIVFAVFAAIGGVAGVIFAVANFVLK